MTPPLTGLRVLELANLMAGPFCGLVLADLGADVVKIENPQGGDFSRATPPSVRGVSAGFLALNRNKRSLALDLKAPAGREVFLRLARRADVVLENFRPGTVRDLGIDYQTLRAGQSPPRLLLRLRLRAVGALQPARRARPDHAGHVRDHERHRGARAAPGQGGRPCGRPDGGPLRRQRHPGRPAGPGAQRAGTADRRQPLRSGRGPGGLGDQRLLRHRRRPPPPRLRPPHQRPLPGLPHRGRLRHPGGHHPPYLGVLLRRPRPGAPAGRPPLRHQRPA